VPRRQAIKDLHREQRIFGARVLIAAFIVVLLAGLLVGRLVYLQVASYSHFTTLSQNNRVRLEPVPPPRGLIFDRNGVVLAENRPAYSLELVPEAVEDVEDTLSRLGELIALREIDLERFRRALRGGHAFERIPLRFNLSDEEVARFAVQRHQFAGVDIEARLNRHYPMGADMAHAVGYVGRIDERELFDLDVRDYRGTTHIGKTGVERYYESLLHGTVGVQQVEVNAQGRVLRVLDREPPEPGLDLVLGLDAELQRVAMTALGDYNGAVVALDPRTGEVLALTSVPSFDPNPFVNGIATEDFRRLNEDRYRPLFNRALSGQYPPGSTIKPLVGLAALENDITTAEHTMFARGYYTLPNDERRYRDWKREGHGWVDLDRAIYVSSDVYFYDLAYRLGIDRMHESLAEFGLGRSLGLDSTGERSGLLPSRDWKRGARGQRWFPGETLIAGIGQGYMLTTPLQLAAATATIASRGVLLRPHLLREVRGEVAEPVRPQVLGTVQLRRPEHWDQIITPMEHVVHHERGTAYWTTGLRLRYRMAGKTGTSQVFGLGEDEEYVHEEVAKHLRDHSLFVAFAPVEEPRIAVAVIAEHAGSGSAVAAPAARQVIDAYLLRDQATAAEVADAR
jgi:penicillin-binding protein 2